MILAPKYHLRKTSYGRKNVWLILAPNKLLQIDILRREKFLDDFGAEIPSKEDILYGRENVWLIFAPNKLP
jgi:hypothetical protein